MSTTLNCPRCELELTCDGSQNYGYYGEDMFCSACLYTGPESIFKEVTHETEEEERL